MKNLILAAALAGSGLFALTPAQAAETLNGACVGDLTLTVGSTQTACVGRYDGNVLNNSNNTTINFALDQLGYAGPDIRFDLLPTSSKLSPLQGTHSVNFAGLLNGITYLAIHYGNGRGGPGNSTTFYRLNAANLDVITLNLNASSNAVLFQAGNAIPEPATWAMMVGGFGLLGAAVRRRRRSIATFA